MAKSVVLKLIKQITDTDSIGNNVVVSETAKIVFALIESISQKEFFEAGQKGLKPEYKVTMWGFEYDNQKIIEIDGVRYSVYRTYLRDDERLELYLTKKAGA